MAVDVRRDRSLLWDVLAEVIAARTADTGRAVLDIVDVGGGTGGLAVPFAALGHNVTVVDPSPDALAAAQRRAAEVAAQLSVVQGEAASADSLVGSAAADLVICHNVLEYVDSPADAMAAISRVLRPAATVSVLASNAVAAVLSQALAGRFVQARRLLPAAEISGTGTPGTGTPGTGTPGTGIPDTEASGAETAGLPRRFTLPELMTLMEVAGLRVGEAHGLRIFSGLVPGALTDGDAAEGLRSLEAAAASYPPLRDIAAQLHVLGHR